ncbi:hypothetical protein NEF87_000924 [Candidatus Lokiarchaeum ossiferum]|uniref:Uncharacterized protein n=1 Tax=Candidatus Lokiarchaeum ossiferum TaxID=2951803 RepID=A0ABY6HQA1_9ARCH|nr:hypothetical protein NEF87_000924 [Candidatus Lokiarchaeum sp. B-35]
MGENYFFLISLIFEINTTMGNAIVAIQTEKGAVISEMVLIIVGII